MSEFQDFFKSLPLPFTYMSFSYLGEPSKPRHPTHFFFVNQAISELTARFFNKSGLPHIELKDKNKLAWLTWNLSWGRQFDDYEYKQCAAWQKINHFAGTFLVGKKICLHERMMEFAKNLPNQANFYPLTFTTPDNLNELTQKWKEITYWIEKPSSSSRGEGIIIVSSKDSLPPITNEKFVIQQFIERPLLINGHHKFDVRLYVLVTSVSPLRVYLHQYGLARLAPHEYPASSETGLNISDLSSLITNVSLNRCDSSFSMNEHKFSLQQLYEILEKQGINTNKIISEFERIVSLTMIAAASKIRQYHQSHIQHRHTSFELFGFDILIDENLRCWLMEVNISPSMSGNDIQFDYDQKYQILAEMYNIGRVVDCDPFRLDENGHVVNEHQSKARLGIELYDQYWRNSIIQLKGCKNPKPWDWSNPIFADVVAVRDFLEEKEQLKLFKRVFPRRKNAEEYSKGFARLGYLDRSFLTWISMTKEKRFEALLRGQNIYEQTLDEINSQLS